jgi:hypothetical protein
MTCVQAGRRKSIAQGGSHWTETNRSGQPAVADAFQTTVPILRRHPNLEVNDGDIGWFQDAVPFAEFSEILNRPSTR